MNKPKQPPGERGAKGDFADELWTAKMAQAWIAFRDKNALERNFRSAVLHDERSLIERDPVGTLLRAVQGGEVTAIKEGRETSPEEWAGASNLEGAYFRREDLLRRWPETSRLQPGQPSSIYDTPPEQPIGRGYMRFSEAAYWIASRGGTADFDPNNSRGWRDAIEALATAISEGRVECRGRQHGRGESQAIDKGIFADATAVAPYEDVPDRLFFGSSPIIIAAGRVSDDQWATDPEGTDYFRASGSILYSHLIVERDGVAAIWPPAAEATGNLAENLPLSGMEDDPDLTRPKAGGKLALIKMAIAEIWPHGRPPGMPSTDRANKINSWLSENGHRKTSERSINRAMTGK